MFNFRFNIPRQEVLCYTFTEHFFFRPQKIGPKFETRNLVMRQKRRTKSGKERRKNLATLSGFTRRLGENSASLLSRHKRQTNDDIINNFLKSKHFLEVILLYNLFCHSLTHSLSHTIFLKV